MNCKNCGNEVTEQYCPYCGQKTNIDRINFRNFMKEVSGSVFQVNRGLFFTIRELFLHPGESIRNYFEGKRKPYFKPIAYAFTISTIYYFVSRMLGGETFINDFASGWASGATNEEINAKGAKVIDWFISNYSYTVLLLLPVYSLASHIAFRKFKLNYLEHIVLNAYITGHQAILSIFFALLTGLIGKNDLLEYVSLIVTMGYATWVFWQLFSSATRIGIIVRTSLTYLLYMVLVTILSGIVFAVVAFI